MGPFSGVFASLPGVTCDMFGGANASADQFFLSHCHADHMVGLDKLLPLMKRKNLVRVNHRIYCSAITKAFVLRKFGAHFDRFVKDLVENEPQMVSVFDKRESAMYKLRVTSIPAHHCPGSVMFLFERLSSEDPASETWVKNRILYTGDFRYDNISLQTLASLHDPEDGKPLALDEMYLDTTFCSIQYDSFPSRNEAIDSIWHLVDGWIRKNGMYRHQKAKHVVLFTLPAQYGSEAILKAIYQKSGAKWKVHVSRKKYDDYLCAEDLKFCTDSNPAEAQWIHACSWKDDTSGKPKEYFKRDLPCQDGPFEVRQIRPSAMYFCKSRLAEMVGEDKVAKCTGGQMYRVCYSCHSSLNELKDFVKYFQPKKVFPCVLPKDSTYQQVMELLGTVMDHKPNLNDIVLVDNSSSPELSSICDLSQKVDTTTSSGGHHRRNLDLLENLKSPGSQKKSDSGGGRKRKMLISFDVASAASCAKSARHITFDAEDDSSDCEEEEVSPLKALKAAHSKRMVFKKSRKDKGACSMPVTPSDEWCDKNEEMVYNKHNRRASLPHNLKIPAITITPSSPSPDPNHPDYPEFFEDRIYLETKNMSTSTEESSKSSNEQQSTSVDMFHTTTTTNNTSSSTTLAETDNNDDSSSLEICFESAVTTKSTISDDVVMLEDHGEDDNIDDEENSTPELDTVMAKAHNAEERRNCINYAEGQAAKRQKCIQ